MFLVVPSIRYGKVLSQSYKSWLDRNVVIDSECVHTTPFAYIDPANITIVDNGVFATRDFNVGITAVGLSSPNILCDISCACNRQIDAFIAHA
jgi:hypothetical protein